MAQQAEKEQVYRVVAPTGEVRFVRASNQNQVRKFIAGQHAIQRATPGECFEAGKAGVAIEDARGEQTDEQEGQQA